MGLWFVTKQKPFQKSFTFLLEDGRSNAATPAE